MVHRIPERAKCHSTNNSASEGNLFGNEGRKPRFREL
jgi:hypothetical protein